MIAIAVAAGFACPIAPPASAQATVIGNGLGKACYDATLSPTISYPKAIETCNKALNSLTLSRNDRTASLVNRGILFMRSGQFPKADRDFARARAAQPGLAEIDLNLGALRLYQGRNAEAVELLSAAIEAETSDLAAAYYNRGVARLRLELAEESYADFVMAAELAPDWDMPKEQLKRFTIQSAG